MNAELLATAIKALLADGKDTGGGTVSLTGNQIPVHGYMVGGFVDSLLFDRMYLDTADIHAAYGMIVRFIDDNHELAADPETFLGIWLDGTVFYVDFSHHYDDREEAVLAGKRNEELAIWNLSKGVEIRV